jgi:hypothetical protein
MTNNESVSLESKLDHKIESLTIQEVEALSNEVRLEALEVFGQNILKTGLSVLHTTQIPLNQNEVAPEKSSKDSALVLWTCVLGTLGSDRFVHGKLVEFDAHRALIAIDNVSTLGFTWGKTLLKIDVLGMGKPISFLGIAQETRSRKSDSGLGLLVVSFSQMNDATKELMWSHLFH